MTFRQPGDFLEVDLQMKEIERREKRELELRAERDLETRRLTAAARMPVTTALRPCAQTERRPEAQNATQTAMSRDEDDTSSEEQSTIQNSPSPKPQGDDCIRVACRGSKSPSAKTLGKRKAVDTSHCDPRDGTGPAPKRSKSSNRTPGYPARSASPSQSRERAISIPSISSLQISDQPFAEAASLREARFNSAGPASSEKIDSKSPTEKRRPRRDECRSKEEYLTLLEHFKKNNDDHEATDDESEPPLPSVDDNRLRTSNEAKYKYHMLWLASRTIQGCIPDLEAAIAGTKGDARSLWDGSTEPLKIVLTWSVLDDAVGHITRQHASEAWRIRQWLKGRAVKFGYEVLETVVVPIWRPRDWKKEAYWQGAVKPRDVPTMATWYREHKGTLPEVPRLGDGTVASQVGTRRMGVLYEPGTTTPIKVPEVRRLTPAHVQRGEMPEEVWRRLQAQRPRLCLPYRIEQTRERVNSQQLPAIRVFQSLADPNVTLSEPGDLDRVIFGEW
ncbi:hypothetical protein B0A48_05186 [Cryoendolithus antarcticus]|uniref:Uncharacterized protein n=1 Tax=Cryoendolithus antarcticus TaxID=1507870 RepID=A0A1V8TI62_9PEZI|nr:hypothetical protein B0A48_05186 [Cryoendolithus antarcticus]